jgi:hypothetical protein
MRLNIFIFAVRDEAAYLIYAAKYAAHHLIYAAKCAAHLRHATWYKAAYLIYASAAYIQQQQKHHFNCRLRCFGLSLCIIFMYYE